jgi:mitochondrial intermediate peptidase
MIEIPSHVFERFASEPSALAVLGKASSGQAPPTEVIDAVVAAKRHCAALNLQSTLQLCVLDQQLHGSQPPMGLDAHKNIAQAMYRQHGVLGVETGALPQLRFVHLVGYGAGYYTYLFAQALSASLWRDAACIQGSVSDSHGESSSSSSVGFGDASRENDANGYNWPNGELLRRKLLEPGGAKEPRTYIQGLFAGKKNVLVDVPGGGCYPEYESLLEVVSVK